jgi:hypothetical protein
MMSVAAWLLVIAALALVVACGVFVAAETSLITVDRASVHEAAEAGDPRAAGVRRAVATLSTQLSGAQVGVTVTNLATGHPQDMDAAGGDLEAEEHLHLPSQTVSTVKKSTATIPAA